METAGGGQAGELVAETGAAELLTVGVQGACIAIGYGADVVLGTFSAKVGDGIASVTLRAGCWHSGNAGHTVGNKDIASLAP